MPDRKTIAAEYGRLLKAHALPPYAELAEFDLDAIPHDTTHPLREVAKKIFERTDSFRKIVEGLLQPEGISDMQEAEALSAQNEEIAAILRQLMRIDRELLLAELDNGEAAYAGFVRDAVPAWNALKPRIAAIGKRLVACWEHSTSAKGTLHYLG